MKYFRGECRFSLDVITIMSWKFDGAINGLERMERWIKASSKIFYITQKSRTYMTNRISLWTTVAFWNITIPILEMTKFKNNYLAMSQIVSYKFLRISLSLQKCLFLQPILRVGNCKLYEILRDSSFFPKFRLKSNFFENFVFKIFGFEICNFK